MGMKDIRPKLSVGNHIYLYQLLSSALGCGKQTLMPRVEEALEAERMGAEDLGYESTRELLEELDDFVDLTVFKGGRVYATIVAQPAWDEALAAPEKKQAAPAGKPWKRKKADKGLKAVKPKRVKRPEPEPEPAPEPEPEAAAEVPTPSVPANDAAVQQDNPVDAQPADSGQEPAPESTPAPDGQPADATDDADASAADESGNEDPAPTQADAADEPQPAISLTVVYDPENANAGMKTLASTPGIAMSEAVAGTDTPSTPQEEVEEQPKQTEAPAVSSAPEAEAGRTRRRVHRSASPAVQADGPQVDGPRVAARRHHVQPAAQEAAAEAPTGAPSGDTHDTPAQAPQVATENAADRPSPEPSRPDAPAAQDARDAAAAEPAHASQPRDIEHAPHDGAPAPAPAPAAPAPAPSTDARPVQSEPTLPAGYPYDLTVDAFCSGALLSEISYLLPYGADVMGILNEYYHIALLRGTLACARNRATFPMSYAKDGERRYATVCIKRNTAAHGTPWVIDSVQE